MEGRFISKDPIGFKGGITLYNYTKNNPVKYTDPMGLYPCNGGIWDQNAGISDWQFSLAFGGSLNLANVHFNCRSNSRLKCSAKQVCIGGGPLASLGFSFNFCGTVYNANDSNNLSGWSGWQLTSGAGPVSVQGDFSGGGNIGAGPGIGAGFAFVRCYTYDLKCNSPCEEK